MPSATSKGPDTLAVVASSIVVDVVDGSGCVVVLGTSGPVDDVLDDVGVVVVEVDDVVDDAIVVVVDDVVDVGVVVLEVVVVGALMESTRTTDGAGAQSPSPG